MLDRYVRGSASRISPEAPVPIVEFEREELVPGGAANVARNLASLGADVELFGVIGRDPSARQLKGTLSTHGIRFDSLITSASRRTSVKCRILAGRQQMLRVDEESRSPIPAAIERRLSKTLIDRLAETDAVIFADYGKGVVTDRLHEALLPECRQRGIWTSLDPHPQSSLKATGLSLMTPNRSEAFRMAGVNNPGGMDDTSRKALFECGAQIMARHQPALLLITLGPDGMLLCGRHEDPVHIPTAAREVFDVSGAGDTVVAAFTLAITAGASPTEAAVLANHAAGIVVAKIGTASLTADELLATFRK